MSRVASPRRKAQSEAAKAFDKVDKLAKRHAVLTRRLAECQIALGKAKEEYHLAEEKRRVLFPDDPEKIAEQQLGGVVE